jgi:hypothetical protein
MNRQDGPWHFAACAVEIAGRRSRRGRENHALIIEVRW